MLQDSLFIQNISKLSDILDSDSVIAPVIELANNPIALKNTENNWGFILFFTCFFIIVSVISKNNKFIISLLGRLFRNNERNSMFYENVTNETYNKIFLCIQTIILFSIIIYCYAVHENLVSISSLTEILIFIGEMSLLLIIFLLYKFLTYSIIGAVFFKRETMSQWNEDFFSLISINGILIFIPVLIIFYVEKAYAVCIYFFIFYFILNLFFIFYKIYTLFFQDKQLFFYFILYLCTQEIIPLYLIYRGFLYLISQKGTIWM